MHEDEAILTVERITNHTFQNKSLIKAALTHPSAVEGLPVSASYERLEFLGDSILGAIIAFDMFEKFPDMNEGELTRMKISLVSGKTLSDVAEKLGIGTCIIFGDSEKGTGARGLTSALENVYEAIVGALFLDAGCEACCAFIRETLSDYMTPQKALHPISPKSRLQELAQQHFHDVPVYKLEKETGPAHMPHFQTAVYLCGELLGHGIGTSKKESQTNAARAALEELHTTLAHKESNS